MNDTFSVQVFEPQDDTNDDEFRFFLIETFSRKMMSEISSRKIVKY